MPAPNEKGYKYEQVYEEIMRCLHDRKYRLGSRLPSERQLAMQLGVNIATVRRGYKELTLAGIVEKKIGSGAYLRCLPDAAVNDKPITLLLPHELCSTAIVFTETITQVMLRAGRRHRVLLDSSPDIKEQLASNIQYGMPTLLLGLPSDYSVIAELINQNPHLFIVFSTQTDHLGIPYVMCDDQQGMKLLVEHLKSMGHHRIALASTSNANENIQIEGWKTALGPDYSPDLLLTIPTKGYELMDDFREFFSSHPVCGKYTAIILLSEESMVGAVSGLRSQGLRLPEDVAIASVGNGPLCRNIFPPITTYDPDIEGHVLSALALLTHNMQHPENLKMNTLVTPKLIVRASTMRQ